MKSFVKILCFALYALAVAQLGTAGSGPGGDLFTPSIASLDTVTDTTFVDDNWTSQLDVDVFNSATGRSLVWGTSAFGTIPSALAGQTERILFIRPGLYSYQVHAINFTYLRMIGSGVDSTILRAPVATMPDIYFAGGPSRPILFLDNCAAHVSGMTIDGDGRGANNSRMIGVSFWNSSGSMSDVSILNVRDTPMNSNPQGVGISVNHNDALPHTVDLTNIYIAGFQKNGTSFTGAGITVHCNNVTAVGIGPTNVVIQNGIQYSSGASGTITNCDVRGIIWSSSLWIASSLLNYQAGTVVISNTTASNSQVGLYSVDTDCSVDSCVFESSTTASTAGNSGVRLYSGAIVLASFNAVCQIYSEDVPQEGRAHARSLDAQEVVSLSNTQLIGHGSAGSYGVYTFVDGDTLEVSISSCEIINWARGVDLTASVGGNIWPASVTGTKLSNVVNAFDNTSNHTWFGNCYSDYTTNFGFPGTYEIAGAVNWNIDPSPNPNGCYDVNLLMEDATVGCEASECDTVFLFVTLRTADLPNMQLDLQLPTGFAVGLPPSGAIVTPELNADPNLIQSFAIATSGGGVMVDAGFQLPGSSGDSTQYFARIPIVNVSATTGTHAVTTESCLWVDINGGEHFSSQDLGVAAIKVDCTDPVISQYTTSYTCAFGSASQTANKFSATITDASGVESAWVTVLPNGGSIPVFTSGNASPLSFTFPAQADTTAFYALLTEGVCNTVEFYAIDTKCNASLSQSIANIGRDETAPALSVANTTPPSFCFNNTPASSNYGGTLLDDYLNISAQVNAVACGASTGTMVISHAGSVDFVLTLDRTNYPETDVSALDLWNWMLTVPGLSSANGDLFIFDVRTEDCAGNISAPQQFDICVDTQSPQNAVTSFDARPAHLGVWLKWSWNAGPDAKEMRIYRSPLSGEYPAYPNDLWSSTSNYDVNSVPPAGWTLVHTQIVGTGTVTAGTSIGVANNRGDFHMHVAGADTFWLDSEIGWEDGDANSLTYRDIYRYVTIVKDAGGNWSIGDTVEILENADRSTNYWLGDFSTADAPGDTFSRGRVDTDDLGLLSAVYFTNAGGYRNIGPVSVENGFIGRGIPDPDAAGAIEFQDLAPFSFNFHSVSPIGIVSTEFSIEPDPSLLRPLDRLDESPVVTLSVQANETESTEQVVTVTVLLRGNESNVVKAVETKLQYNRAAYALVETSSGDAHTESGTIFTKVSEVERSHEIGIVAASCGGTSTLNGNATLATIKLRKLNATDESTSFVLHATSLLDNSGSIRELDDVEFVVSGNSPLPTSYALRQNYPNPFNPSTQITFDLPETANIEVTVFNTNGQLVATLINESRKAGTHTVTWDAGSLASGVYIYRLESNHFTDTKKMILLK
jgi:hypothetical protein